MATHTPELNATNALHFKHAFQALTLSRDLLGVPSEDLDGQFWHIFATNPENEALIEKMDETGLHFTDEVLTQAQAFIAFIINDATSE